MKKSSKKRLSDFKDLEIVKRKQQQLKGGNATIVITDVVDS